MNRECDCDDCRWLRMLVHLLDPDRAHVLRTYISALEQECGCCECASGEQACAREYDVPADVHEQIVRFRQEVRVCLVRPVESTLDRIGLRLSRKPESGAGSGHPTREEDGAAKKRAKSGMSASGRTEQTSESRDQKPAPRGSRRARKRGRGTEGKGPDRA